MTDKECIGLMQISYFIGNHPGTPLPYVMFTPVFDGETFIGVKCNRDEVIFRGKDVLPEYTAIATGFYRTKITKGKENENR